MTVTKIPYEIVGEGIPIAEKFYAEFDAKTQARWDAVTALGAVGYRPGWRNSTRSLFFKELPNGYRKIGSDKGMVECVPHRGSKLGKEFSRQFAAIPRVPDEGELPDLFGWEGRSPFDGRLIYRAVAVRLELPTTRYLIRLPRADDDGYVPPPTLREMLQSEFVKAFEEHNAAARAEAA